ncbi:MAG: uracil-DNA glycosylase [Pseudorhodobacter sp.]|nr:uracil-DNA glycosylase [Pseudorhodobacter sp.]
MPPEPDYHTAVAMLAWQQELGATDLGSDAPVNRFELPEAVPVVQTRVAHVAQVAPAPVPAEAVPPPQRASARPAPVAAAIAGPDAVAQAAAVAARATSLAQLRAAIESFDLCVIKRGARSTVFADGNPAARVMVIGEAPGRDEDAEGLPFVGRAGQLLDRMFAAIGLGRISPDPARALYITNVMPWRPPQNRDPLPEEIAMMQPFLARHVELAAPELLVVMGNIACQAVLGQRGVTRLRGTWAEAYGRPVLAMVHPAYLLRNPAAKRETWADLLALQARLRIRGS